MYSYNDGLEPAGRRPRLYLAKGGEVRKFMGENIPGWCAVVTAQYTKQGKWSNTQYGADWSKPSVVAPEGAKIISARHSPGSHGGYWTIEVVVPIAQPAA